MSKEQTKDEYPQIIVQLLERKNTYLLISMKYMKEEIEQLKAREKRVVEYLMERSPKLLEVNKRSYTKSTFHAHYIVRLFKSSEPINEEARKVNSNELSSMILDEAKNAESKEEKDYETYDSLTNIIIAQVKCEH